MELKDLLLGLASPNGANPLRELAASNVMGRADPGPDGNWIGAGNKAEDPLLAFLAQGAPQSQAGAPEEVADPLVRALEYAQQKRAQIGEAPKSDPSIMPDMMRGQRDQELAAALMGQGYVPNSGPLGALAQVFSAYSGRKLDRKAGETLADAMQRQMEADQATAQYADKVKEFDEGPRRILERTEQARALGLDGQAAREFVLTGKMPRNAAGPASLQEFKAAQGDPEFAAFLRDRDAKRGTQVNVSLPPGQKAFDVELGKADAKTYAGWRDNAVQAQRTLDQLSNIEEILSLQQTGKVQEAMALAGQYFGTEAGANLQSLKGAIQPVVLAQVRQLGSGNGITDADRKFIEAGMPGFGNDPRANERVMRIMRQSAQANVRLFDEADRYLSEQGSLRGFRPTIVPAGGGGGGGSNSSSSNADPLGIREDL